MYSAVAVDVMIVLMRAPQKAPTFLTIQVSRELLNNAIRNLNAYAAPRVATASSSELLLTMDEIMAVIDQGRLSRTLLLSAAHLKRVEVRAPLRKSLMNVRGRRAEKKKQIIHTQYMYMKLYLSSIRHFCGFCA